MTLYFPPNKISNRKPTISFTTQIFHFHILVFTYICNLNIYIYRHSFPNLIILTLNFGQISPTFHSNLKRTVLSVQLPSTITLTTMRKHQVPTTLSHFQQRGDPIHLRISQTLAPILPFSLRKTHLIRKLGLGDPVLHHFNTPTIPQTLVSLANETNPVF
ncbi:hypothetical protein V8G54_020297 [Vigna mungo]|uniref:Uncharacterized protein n=1 Tax=Vigna mungo TaxID=3915 RepID=A0AAQ3NDE4_VIGMU